MNLYLATLFSTPDEENPDIVILCPVVIPAVDHDTATTIAEAVASQLQEQYGVEMTVDEVLPDWLHHDDGGTLSARVAALERRNDDDDTLAMEASERGD
jgi:hypothetical protein